MLPTGVLIWLLVSVVVDSSTPWAIQLLQLPPTRPSMNHPYLSDSLEDFWGRRYNLVVSYTLRHTVYNPIVKKKGQVTPHQQQEEQQWKDLHRGLRREQVEDSARDLQQHECKQQQQEEPEHLPEQGHHQCLQQEAQNQETQKVQHQVRLQLNKSCKAVAFLIWRQFLDLWFSCWTGRYFMLASSSGVCIMAGAATGSVHSFSHCLNS